MGSFASEQQGPTTHPGPGIWWLAGAAVVAVVIIGGYLTMNSGEAVAQNLGNISLLVFSLAAAISCARRKARQDSCQGMVAALGGDARVVWRHGRVDLFRRGP